MQLSTSEMRNYACSIDAAYVYQCAQVAKQVFERPVAEEPTSV
jgi:hypothetical protein